VPEVRSGEPLGYYVTIDGENGRATPFLAVEIERVRVARVRRADSVPSSSSSSSLAASLAASGALAGSGESERR
jgi:hypothetical protein